MFNAKCYSTLALNNMLDRNNIRLDVYSKQDYAGYKDQITELDAQNVLIKTELAVRESDLNDIWLAAHKMEN